VKWLPPVTGLSRPTRLGQRHGFIASELI